VNASPGEVGRDRSRARHISARRSRLSILPVSTLSCWNPPPVAANLGDPRFSEGGHSGNIYNGRSRTDAGIGGREMQNLDSHTTTWR